jgi:hypothetical protein
VEQFKYLEATLIKQIPFTQKITSTLKPQNTCYHLVKTRLSSSLVSKNIKIKIYRNIILQIVLYGCETWSLTLREEHRLWLFDNWVLRKTAGPNMDKVRETTQQGALWSVLLTQYYSCEQIKKNEMGGARGTYGRRKRQIIQGFGRETCRKENASTTYT